MKGDTTLLIVGKSKPKGAPSKLMKPEEDESSDDLAEAKATAGEVFADAVKNGDGKAIADAFQDLYDLCAMHDSEPDEGEDY
jgi:hypothetical protein